MSILNAVFNLMKTIYAVLYGLGKAGTSASWEVCKILAIISDRGHRE